MKNMKLSAKDRSRKIYNQIWLGVLCLLAFAAIMPLFFIFAYLLVRGWAGLSLSFFTEIPKPVGEVGGGMANAISGSLVLMALAAILGVPLGITCGMTLVELRKSSTAKFLRVAIDLLTSVPSIVVGLFAYALVVVPMKGYSAWAGGFALAIVMVPIVARSTEEILKLVPRSIHEAGLALGIPRWKVLVRLILPGVKTGVTTGVLLALARVSGETAPLLFTAFSNSFGFRGLSSPTASLPVQIYTYATSHDETWRQLAWTGALVLVFVVFCLNLLTRILMRRT
ncbi:MAG: phosphate ABC transporter permease PstA [Bdellovibrionales bacterium]|jgi:phosphate transport system permease protein|nr:phosphate ABC transporter permease PstA [Bdellovibrionales bacterium]